MDNLLSTIKSPDDVKKLNEQELSQLCADIRARLIQVISKNGGHLASNLGVVELTVALHRVFSVPTDQILFDVGHQCYTHKLLTGRADKFDTIRRKDGISGFPKPSESDTDPVIAGHASSAMSTALGLARAKRLKGEDGKVIAVVGDGAFAGGMTYEAMNNIAPDCGNLLVILNDNSMSISKSVGALSKYLMKVRTRRGYQGLKDSVKVALEHVPLVGDSLVTVVKKYKRRLRRKMYDGTIFEELGFNYVGPVDGQDLPLLVQLLENLKNVDEPVLLHINTQKGHGYALAENNPGAYHGVSGFTPKIETPDIALDNSFSNVFGNTLAEAAEKDKSLCAITAAMKYATGLNHFAKKFPERFFDVGIAEQHAVTFAAGLSRGGFNPVVAVYSTFLQRAFDQIAQDVILSKANVFFAVDRAGLVGEDGETHQGVYDPAFLSEFAGMQLWSPCNYSELYAVTRRLLAQGGARAVRYPRGSEDYRLNNYKYTGEAWDLIEFSPCSDTVVVTYGRIVAEVFECQKRLHADGGGCDIIKLNRITPLDEAAVAKASAYKRVVFVEEALPQGAVGQRFATALLQIGWQGTYRHYALCQRGLKQMSVRQAIKLNGLDGKTLYSRISALEDDEKKS